MININDESKPRILDEISFSLLLYAVFKVLNPPTKEF